MAEYTYNGLNFRIGWHYDTNKSSTVDGSDPWFWFCYDEQWRIVATFRDTDSSPKEQFLHHNAGLGGAGSSSYIDSVILRQKDNNTAWESAADGTLEERRYYCQNWRSDVSAVLTDTGKMVEWAKYSAYGVPFGLPAGDTDSDGDWDATDSGVISGSLLYDVRKDPDLDGDVDSDDITHANSIAGGYQTLGRGTLSSASVRNRSGYAGYELDNVLAGAKWHVRNRVLDSELGRWLRRDPLGYVDGVNLYGYVAESPVRETDPTGLIFRMCRTDLQDKPHGPCWVVCQPPFGNQGTYGATSCGAHRCCICVSNIYARWPDALEQIADCVEVVESHNLQNCNRIVSLNCRECAGYRSALACLRSAQGRCTTLACFDQIQDAIAEAIVQEAHYCMLCALENQDPTMTIAGLPTDPTPGGNGTYVPCVGLAGSASCWQGSAMLW